MEAHAILRGDATVSVGGEGIVEMIDTFDRPGKAFAVGTYADAGAFEEGCEDKPGKRIPKAGLYAGAGVGCARAEWSIFEAEAKGPNASAGVGLSVLGAKAFAKAEVASASASAGPLKAKVGLALDTGIGIGPTNIGVQLLGTGFTIGPRMSISFLGNGIEFNF